MGKLVSGLFGGGGQSGEQKELIRQQTAQLQRQERETADEKAKLAAVEDSQRKMRGGGARGLLAFVDDALGTKFGG